MLEHLVQLTQIRPSLIVEISIANRGANDDAIILHNALVANHLRGKRLHQLNRIGSHTVTIMEILRHTEYHDVIFLLGKRYIGTLIRHNPGLGLHHFRITGIDLDLTGISVQYRVAAEERMAHLFFPSAFRSH